MATLEQLPFQQVLEYVEALSSEEQDLLISLIQKRLIEKRRSEIADNVFETLEAWRQGKASQGSLADLKADLQEEE
jgi:hypothetical protein